MEITIVTLNGTSSTLMVYPGDTVGSLKKRIQDKLGSPCETQKLVFENGQKVQLNDDSKSLSDYCLYSGAKVYLLLQTPPTIQVFLKNEKGQTSTYDIKPDETVDNFKKKVQSREGVPVSQQRLNHQGTDMTGGKLSDYGVTALSTIFLNMRLRGG